MSVVKPLTEFIVAVMVTLPMLTPFASPLFVFGLLMIVAIAVFDEDHVTDAVRSWLV